MTEEGLTLPNPRPRLRFRHHATRPILCSLCRRLGRNGSRRRTRLDRFATAQRDLIASLMQTSFGGDPARVFCVACLSALERRIHSKQIVRDSNRTFFVDLTLSTYPIMPTPMRLGAVSDLTGRGTTICFIDSGFIPHPDFLLPEARLERSMMPFAVASFRLHHRAPSRALPRGTAR